MPNHRKATFMASSMPNRAMKAGRNAVIGMERIGAATGFTRSCIQPKLAISNPSGTATMVHQKKAWAMRHQLWKTLPRRSYSVQSAPKDRMTPRGWGKEKGGSKFQWVRTNQIVITSAQLTKARARRV